MTTRDDRRVTSTAHARRRSRWNGGCSSAPAYLSKGALEMLRGPSSGRRSPSASGLLLRALLAAALPCSASCGGVALLDGDRDDGSASGGGGGAGAPRGPAVASPDPTEAW